MKENHYLKTTLWPAAIFAVIAIGAWTYRAIQTAGAQASPEAGTAHEAKSRASAQDAPASKDEHGHAEGEDHDEVTLTTAAIQQHNIRLAPARRQILSDPLTVPGRVSYNLEQMAHVGTSVEGRIADIRTKLGDEVKKGDELLVLDSPTLGEAQSSFLQKRTAVQVAESAVEVAQTTTERAKKLMAGKGIALGEYQRREGERKTAEGTLKAAHAALTAAENALHLLGMNEAAVKRLIQTGEVVPRYTVRAPIAGRIIQRHATLGEIVKPESEPLLVLADMRTLWVVADVPENQIHRIGIGTTATVVIGALGKQSFAGKVSYVAPELDKQTRTAQVRVEIADGKTPLMPGMFAQVHFLLDQILATSGSASLVAVPEAAIQNVEGGPAVFVPVENEPNTFAKQAVVVAPAVGDMVPILSGLEEGRRYVREGAFILKSELAKGIMEGKTCSGH